jgi:hypothetical protein
VNIPTNEKNQPRLWLSAHFDCCLDLNLVLAGLGKKEIDASLQKTAACHAAAAEPHRSSGAVGLEEGCGEDRGEMED